MRLCIPDRLADQTAKIESMNRKAPSRLEELICTFLAEGFNLAVFV